MTSMNEEKDWYEHRHELEVGDVFTTHWEGKVALDRKASDVHNSAWYVVDCINGYWYHNDNIIHPIELKARIERHYG